MATAPRNARRHVAPRRQRGWLTLLIFLPPALLLFTVFVAMPMGEAAWYSFYNWNGYGRPAEFRRPQNYVSLLGNAVFERALLNNLLIIVVSLAGPVAARARRRADSRQDGSSAPSPSA